MAARDFPMEVQTRIGVGASAVFALVSYFTPTLGWVISTPILAVCGIIALWGLWPLARSLPLAAARYWNSSGRKHAVGLGILLVGVGLGWAVSNGQNFAWTLSPDTGRIVWNFEQAATGHGYFLNMQKPANQEVRIIGFGAHGKNNSAEPISDFEANLRSDATNETIPIYIVAAEADAVNACTLAAPTLPKDTLGIPGFADFDIVSYEKPYVLNVLYDGKALSNFLRTFVPFTIIMHYDGKTYQRRFSKDEVDRQVAILEKAAGPITNPHVVRKRSLPPAAPPPLTTLTHPQSSPVPPGLLPLKPPPAPDADVTGKIPGE
jgi:hypothetical protein